MDKINIRRAVDGDTDIINKLLFEVHKVHSDIRPDLFKPGMKKYTDDELKEIIGDDGRPIFVAEKNGTVLGYIFCVFQQHINSKSMTDIKTLYIDDLCVDENARNMHIGRLLYEYVVGFAKENGCYNVTLNVWAGNDNALRFYEKLGLKVQKTGMEKIL